MAQPAPVRNLGRLSEIAQVAVRHGFGYFFEAHRLTDLPLVGLAYLRLEQLLTPPSPWRRRVPVSH